MKRWFWAVAGLIVAGLVFWQRDALFPGEAGRVTAVLNQMAKDVSFGPGEGNVTAIRRVSSVVDRFAPNVSVQLEVLGVGEFQLTGRDEIQQRLLGVRRVLRKLELKFHDIIVTVADDRQTADVHLTATADGEGEGRNAGGFEALEFDFKMSKPEGRWRIDQITTVPTLKQ